MKLIWRQLSKMNLRGLVCQLEKPLGAEKFCPIHKKWHQVCSRRLKLSTSFEQSQNVSCHRLALTHTDNNG